MTQKWKSRNTLTHQIDTKNSKPRDLLGGPVAKNPPCNAGDVGSIPYPGTKILHATEQLSPTTESRLSRNLPHTTTGESMCRNKRSHKKP